MSTPAAPSKPSGGSKRKVVLGVIIIAILLVVLVPVALAGAFTVPVATATFTSTTGSLGATNLQVTTQTMIALQYYLSVRTGGMVRTTDQSTSTSSGTTNITLSMKLTNPSNQTIDLGNTNISGGIGTRSHTVYLSVDQGVRASGTYKLDIVVSATVSVGGILEAQANLIPVELTATFVVS